MNSTIIFDMDGTLFQTNLTLESALEETFEQLRLNGHWQCATPIDQYRDIMGVPLPVVWETLCPNHSTQLRNETNLLFQKALIEQIKLKNGALYDGVEKTLPKLAANYTLFIASNGQTAYLQAIVETYQLSKWFQGVYSIDCIPSGNKSELVAMIVKQHHLQHGFVVGDRASDIQAALHNELISIGVRFDFAQEAELAKAHYIVDRFEEIVAIIEQESAHSNRPVK